MPILMFPEVNDSYDIHFIMSTKTEILYPNKVPDNVPYCLLFYVKRIIIYVDRYR